MAVSQDPAVQRRRLRIALRDIRQTLSLSQKEVADALDWSPSKLLRIENGTVTISRSDLLALLHHYGVNDQGRVDEFVTMAQIAKRQTWTNYRDVLRPDTIVFMEMESAAFLIKTYMPFAIPSLLQTEEYATALTKALAPELTDVEVAKVVQARMERQELINRSDPPELRFVMDEAVVRRQVGRGKVMLRQLEHMKALSANPNVKIRILPFSAGVHSGMREPFIILDFPDAADDDLLYIERSQMLSRDAPEEVARYNAYFFELRDLAVPEGEVQAFLDKVIEELEVKGSS